MQTANKTQIPFLRRLINSLSKTITQICFKVPKKGTIFGVIGGDYTGKMFVLIDSSLTDCHFLTLPDIKNQTVSKFELKRGIKDGVLEKVEILPRDMYLFLKEQYLYNKKHK